MEAQFSSPGHPEYSATYYQGPQGLGTAWLHRSLKRYWVDSAPKTILEVGFGSGEHLHYHRIDGPAILYGLDPEPSHDPVAVPAGVDLRLLRGVAEELPLPDHSIDRVVMTCVLAHVDSPVRACEELLRVIAPRGELAIALPTDPGAVNRLIKAMVTYRKLRSEGVVDPRYFYAIQHRNSVNNLLAIVSHVVRSQQKQGRSLVWKTHYRPFWVASWNLNPLCIIHIRDAG